MTTPRTPPAARERPLLAPRPAPPAGATGAGDAAARHRRGLGRALLARQHLLARHDGTATDLAAHLVGLQAQAPWAPYTGMWSRLAGFSTADLADRLLDRGLVRLATLRGTVHLHTADDALVLPVLTGPLLRASLRTAQPYRSDLADVDLDEVAAAARAIVEAEPTRTTDLGRRLGERWPDVDPRSLAYAARCTLPLVQVTPRAVWGRSGATTWTTTRAWLGREPADLDDPDAWAAALDALVLRYLAAFGPASAADVQAWSGLTGLGPVLRRLRPRLVVVPAAPGDRSGAGGGRELFDLPDAPRPGPDVPAPVRLLPEYDDLLVGHADRTRMVTDDDRRRMWRANGTVPGALLVDGAVAGSWTVRRSGGRTGTATLVLTPFRPLPAAARADAEREAGRLLRTTADDVDRHTVGWADDDAPPGGLPSVP